MSAFMVPQYDRGEFVHTDSVCIPSGYYDPEHHGPEEDRHCGWYCRLSAPGYMDCTDWSGPYETEQEAREAIVDMWDVDPDSGDQLPEEGGEA